MQHFSDDLISYLEQKFVAPFSNATPDRRPDVEFILDRNATVRNVRGAQHMRNGDSIHAFIYFQDLPKFIEVMKSDRESCIIHNRFPCEGRVDKYVWQLDSLQGGGAPWQVAVWK